MKIVTKAIVGKGKKFFRDNYSVEAEHVPTTVLGCWVINHKFKGFKSGDKVGVDGSYDVNIWYSYDNDSKTNVVNKRIEYNDLFNVKLKNETDSNDTDIIVRTLKQPNCVKVNIEGNKIIFDVEKELGVEIVGEAKIKIAIEDDEDPWDELDEEMNSEVEKTIDETVKEEYL